MEKSQNEENTINETIISNHKYNFYQQFFIMGFDPRIMSNINNIDLYSLNEPYSTPKIISKYPNVYLPYLIVPDELVASHCFPQGLINAIIEYNDNKDLIEKENQIQTFIFSLENMCPQVKVYSLRTKKVYYTCLLFYEDIEKYRNCIEQRKYYKTPNNDKEKNNKGLLIPKVICLSSFNPFHEQTKSVLMNLRNYVKNFYYNNKSKDNINIYPIEKIIERLIFNLPAIPRGNFSLRLGNDSFSYKKNKENEKVNNNDELDTSDIIFQETPPNENPRETVNFSLLMYYFRIEEIFEIIKYIILEEPILFFSDDKEVLTTVIESFISLIYPFEYPYPVISILPEQNFSLITLFEHFIFGINYKYVSSDELNKIIILDGVKFIRIIRIDKRFNNLLNSAERDPLNYSIFTSAKFDENKPLIKFDQIKKNAYINDILDTKLINDKKKIILPRHYFEKCCRILEKNVLEKLKEIDIKYKNQPNKKIINVLKRNAFNKEIREDFIYFFSCILLKYQEYCIKYEKKIYEIQDKNGKIVEKEFQERSLQLEEKFYIKAIKINDIFDVEEFINSTPSLDRPFYRVFFNTKIFLNFMIKKMFPESNQDKFDILYFDEIINKKLSRDLYTQKKDTKFLDFELTKFKGDLSVKTLKTEISDNLKLYLQKKENRFKALNYFQYIYLEGEDDHSSVNKKDAAPKNGQISFHYFVFPILLNDGIFFKAKNYDPNYNLSPFYDYYQLSVKSNQLYNLFEYEAYYVLNDDDITKNYKMYDYSLNPTSQFSFKNDYLIKILWIMYISKCFKRIPFNKKRYYFDIIISFLQKNKDVIDEDSIILLYNSINRNGDRNMNQDIFPFIKNKTYTSYLCAREKIKSEKNFTNFIINQKYINNNNDINDLENDITPSTKDKKEECKNQEENQTNEDNNILKEEKKFFFTANSFCQSKTCNEPISMKISELYSELEEKIKFKCKKCQKEQFLTISCKCFNNNKKEGYDLSNYIINFDLISPISLIQRPWLKNKVDIDPNYICEKYLDCYLSSIFYFYELNLPCNFLLPEPELNQTQKDELKQINNYYYAIIKDKEFFDEQKIKKIYVKNNEKKEEKGNEIKEEKEEKKEKKVKKNELEDKNKKIDSPNIKVIDSMNKVKDDNDYDKLIKLRESVQKQGLKSSFRKKRNNEKNKKKSVEFRLDIKIAKMYDE